ncbi:MAG TPA: hypothetical protein DEG55_05250 [Acidaminococcaceae bacterium]|nr:hypothetical protein [Acidaminococcaceae bacterium]
MIRRTAHHTNTGRSVFAYEDAVFHLNRMDGEFRWYHGHSSCCNVATGFFIFSKLLFNQVYTESGKQKF